MAVPFMIGERTALNPGANDEWFFKDYAYLTASITAFGAATAATLGACSMVAVPIALPSSLVLGGISLLSWAIASLKGGSYADPRDLIHMREAALKAPLLDSINTHGWDHLIRYEILTYPEAQAKFLFDTASWDFKKIVDTFGWDTILTRRLWTYEQARYKYESSLSQKTREEYVY